MTATRSPTLAWAPSARRRPSAIVSPWSPVSDPRVTPTSSPPPRPPLRIWAGMTSSETPRLGPRVVGVSATAERTPAVARASASAAAGRPGPLLVRASSPPRPACRCWVTAWSMVVALNRSVVLRPTVSMRGGLAEEKRGVAVRRLVDARKPPTGAIRATTGPMTPAAMRATIGPRQPTAATRNSAVISDVAAAVSGAPVVAETANRGAAPASAISPPTTRPGPSRRGRAAPGFGPPRGGGDGERGPRAGERDQPADHAPGAEQPRLHRRLGQRPGRRDASGAPCGGEDGEQRRQDAAGDRRRDREPG